MMGDLVWDGWDGDGAWIGNGPDGGRIVLDIPNWIDTEDFKLIQIQMSIQPQPDFTAPDGTVTPGLRPHVALISAFDPTGPVSSGLIDVFETLPDINGILQRVETWELRPNPDYETIHIVVPVDTLVDQIVVDTISTSIPEPSTVCLVGLALAGGALWRRRRK